MIPMIQVLAAIDWSHIITETISLAVTVSLSIWLIHRKTRKEEKNRFEALIKGQESLKIERDYLPLHEHTEHIGPLTVAGIRYKRREGDGGTRRNDGT